MKEVADDNIINDDEELEKTIEESTKVKNGQIEFKYVNHGERAAKFGVLSDGEISDYLNITLKYFNYRCALSGERFEKFKGKTDTNIKTNLLQSMLYHYAKVDMI